MRYYWKHQKGNLIIVVKEENGVKKCVKAFNSICKAQEYVRKASETLER